MHFLCSKSVNSSGVVLIQLFLRLLIFATIIISFFCVNAIALEAGIKSLDTNEDEIEFAILANQDTESELEALKVVADIRVHTAQELEGALSRVEAMFDNGGIREQDEPVIFLLHGDEARTLYKQNYGEHKDVVDLAAKLSAFGVVDIKVCESWSGHHGLDSNRLQPFVETVPFVPAEKKRLFEEEGYSYF